MDNELIEHQTVTAIVENVAKAKEDIKEAFALLIGAKERLSATLGHDSYYDTIIPSGSRFSDYEFKDGAENSNKEITKNAWRYILAQTQLNHYMTEKRKNELETQIKEDRLPPLTSENIYETLNGLADRVNSLLDESIKEVFDWLRPRSKWGVGALKTNKKFKVGHKVIIGYAVEGNYTSGFRIQYHSQTNFCALGNVFSLLDGRGVLKYPDDFITRFNQALEKLLPGESYCEEYFVCKPYKNGNLHVTFKRLDLLKKLNQIGGEGELVGKEGV